MKSSDMERFNEMMAGVCALYRRDFSEALGLMYWRALKQFDYAAVADAFTRHTVNPDAGKFMPLPADIVRMLEGSTQDSALVAWAKVDRAVRTVGTYRSVVFDDALIHRVLTDMGGWTLLGTKTEDEWPFVRNEFVNRYRGFRERHDTPEYPAHLIGLAEANNSKAGFAIEAPMLIGDTKQARRVYLRGTEAPLLQVTHAGNLLDGNVKRLH